MADPVTLPMPQPMDFPERVKAMMSALVQQRNQTADEVVNLVGDLADAREKIATLEARVKELEGRS